MLNGEVVDALSFIIHADKAYSRARKMAEMCIRDRFEAKVTTV